ncbi:hypothetical protein IQ07DRAFT_678369 [Pyrenochaeta sp. DS3sAY3a]|nr:hypothetical protein IQ07DRAFT_678369 [Pyrenochaeta sp. DS3sAY3a]
MSKRSKLWSDEEEAYLLNYLDYCLKHQLRYEDEIATAMSRFTRRPFSIILAMNKLAQLSLRIRGDRSTKALVMNGTNELALQRVPDAVLRAMQAQRAGLGLEDLAKQSDTTNDETPDEHMTNNDTVGESSRNAGNTVRGNESRALALRLVSASTAGYGGGTAKRKAPTSETIDLTKEARPSKRGALGHNTGKAVAGSERTALVSTRETIENSGQDTEQHSQSQRQETDAVFKLADLVAIGSSTIFSEVPEFGDLNMRWKALRSGIRHAFGDNFDINDSSTPNLSRNSKKEVKAYFAKFAPRLKSRYLVETLLGALLCGRLFANPDPTCSTMYSKKELHLLKATVSTEGPARAQQLDKIGAKMLFEGKSFVPHVENEVEFILASMSLAQSQMWPGASGFHRLTNPQDWLRKAIKLRQDLMLSPQEYRIHFSEPGKAFDPTWMKAVDIHDCPVPDNEMPRHPTVLTCMFPALVEEKAPALTENSDVSEVLIVNKKFLPDYLVKFDPSKVVCKAAVLLVPVVESKGTQTS